LSNFKQKTVARIYYVVNWVAGESRRKFNGNEANAKFIVEKWSTL